MKTIADDLRQAVGAAMPRLLAIGDEASARSPAPGKWCPRELIGHLNHGRTSFVWVGRAHGMLAGPTRRHTMRAFSIPERTVEGP
jgi:hypothetical protein